MGDIPSKPYEQNTYKICMICNRHHILNSELMLLSARRHLYKNSSELLLRCSKGHILKYEANTEHIHAILEIIDKKEQSNSDINKLKKEISLLKDEIEIFKNRIEPSAPLLVEAEVIK